MVNLKEGEGSLDKGFFDNKFSNVKKKIIITTTKKCIDMLFSYRLRAISQCSSSLGESIWDFSP
jgi:hypothetical protein